MLPDSVYSPYRLMERFLMDRLYPLRFEMPLVHVAPPILVCSQNPPPFAPAAPQGAMGK